MHNDKSEPLSVTFLLLSKKYKEVAKFVAVSSSNRDT